MKTYRMTVIFNIVSEVDPVDCLTPSDLNDEITSALYRDSELDATEVHVVELAPVGAGSKWVPPQCRPVAETTTTTTSTEATDSSPFLGVRVLHDDEGVGTVVAPPPLYKGLAEITRPDRWSTGMCKNVESPTPEGLTWVLFDNPMARISPGAVLVKSDELKEVRLGPLGVE